MKRFKRSLAVLAYVAFAAALITQALPPRSASAAQITVRSLTLQAGTVDTNGDGIPDGGSLAGGNVRHRFVFTVPSTSTNIGSIRFLYCTTAAPVSGGVQCNAPGGMNAGSATMGDETGSGATGFSVSSAAANEVVLSRATAANPTSGGLNYRLDGIVNPTAVNTTFFVRISTYTSTDGTGTAVDTGSVAASTTYPIEIEGTMPESLVFCTGRTVSTTVSVPDCTTATPGDIEFDQLFSPTDTATATSQMAASTNAGAGYAITVNGPTLTSGSNTIAPMANTETGVSVPLVLGTSQFGLNLVANTTTFNNATPVATFLGLDVAPVSNTTNYRANPADDYDDDDAFKYWSSDIVARSDDGAPGGTDAQIYTVSYVVNVPGSQPAGTYTTTLTYICTPTF
jgi:hypothetical protein